jgi:hypothetical protein
MANALIEIAPEKFVILESKTAAQVDVSAVRSLRGLKAEHGATSAAKAFVACRTVLGTKGRGRGLSAYSLKTDAPPTSSWSRIALGCERRQEHASGEFPWR